MENCKIKQSDIIKSTQEEINVLNELGEDFKQFSEMSNQDRVFLNTLVLRKQPKKLLELGVCSGGSSLIILNAIKNNEKAHLYSIDYNTQHYKLKDKLTGFYVDNFTELKNKWTLKTGGLAMNFMEEIGGNIDFCLIDTVHTNPGEIIDFLMVLPYLKEDAIVVFHDTNYHCKDDKNRGGSSFLGFTNNLLMSSICGIKLLPDNQPYESVIDFSNIGAIELNQNTREHIWEIFNLLTIKWNYMLKNNELEQLRRCFGKFYGEYYSEYFNRVVLHQKKIKILDQQIKEKQQIQNIDKKLQSIQENLCLLHKELQSKKNKYTLLQQIFSVKNDSNHKIITILGIRIKIKYKAK